MRDLTRKRRSLTSIVLLSFGLLSCQSGVVPEGPPPPPPVPAKPYRVAVLSLGRESELPEITTGALKKGMKTFRFTEGPYYTLDVVDLKGKVGSVPDQLADAVRRGADVIAITHLDVLHAAVDCEARKPIVFAVLGDPSILGGKSTESSPLRGMTGAYNPLPTSALLGLVKYYVPNAKRVGVIFNRRDPRSVAHRDAMIRDSAGVSLEVVAEGFDGEDGASAATDALLGQSIEAVCLLAGSDSFYDKVIERAGRSKTPVFGFRPDHVGRGALAAEAQEPEWVGIEAGKLIFQILHGQDLRDQPPRRLVDTATVVNPRVAESLGITLPPGALRNARVVGDP